MAGSISDLGGMFGALDIPFVNKTTLYYLKSYAPMLIVAAIGATPIVKNTVVRLRDGARTGKAVSILEPVVMVALLVVVTAYLVDSSANFFLYFRF
jgi:alginate O-acetyltransferase complex protein AlgI